MPISIYQNKRRLAEIADETPVYLRFGDAYMRVAPRDIKLDADDEIYIDCNKFVTSITEAGQEPAKEAIPITDEWLDSLPQFEQCGTGWWYTTKETPDSPSPHDVEITRREYGYSVTVFTDGCESQLPVKTVETLVAFLRLCGLNVFADKIAKAK